MLGIYLFVDQTNFSKLIRIMRAKSKYNPQKIMTEIVSEK